MSWTGDPIADFRRYDSEQQSWLDKLPRCAECCNPIQTEKCFEYNDELICEDCLKNNHEKWTEDYVET